MSRRGSIHHAKFDKCTSHQVHHKSSLICHTPNKVIIQWDNIIVHSIVLLHKKHIIYTVNAWKNIKKNLEDLPKRTQPIANHFITKLFASHCNSSHFFFIIYHNSYRKTTKMLTNLSQIIINHSRENIFQAITSLQCDKLLQTKFWQTFLKHHNVWPILHDWSKWIT